MIFFKKILPFISGLGCVLVLELFISFPTQWLFFLILLLFIIFFTTLFINSFKINVNFFGFIISPVIFSISGYLSLFFLERWSLKQIIIAVVFVGLLIFWGNMVSFLWNKARYIPYALENISSYMNLLAAFFIFVSSFNFFILGVGRIRYLMFLIFITVLALSWQTLWINKIEHESRKYFPYIFALIFIELFWVMHYLPTSYLVTAIILTTVFYSINNVTRYHLLDNLTNKVIIRYTVISTLVIVSALLTASWT
ncbi:MAG: hypothetical protein ABIF17_01155 [Patescibacteria group bacterium]